MTTDLHRNIRLVFDQTTGHGGLAKLTKKLTLTVGNVHREIRFANVDLCMIVDHKVGDFQQSFRNESDSWAINLPSHIHPFLFRKSLSLEIFLHTVACPIVNGRSISRAFLLSSFYRALLQHYRVNIYHKGLLVITLNSYSDESKEKEKYTRRSLVIMLHKIIRQFRKLLVGNCPSCLKIILILMYSM